MLGGIENLPHWFKQMEGKGFVEMAKSNLEIPHLASLPTSSQVMNYLSLSFSLAVKYGYHYSALSHC